MRDLSTIFEPKSIAVIGATSNPRSVTNVTFLRQLIDFGYPGRIYPVNPHADQVLGLTAYASIGDIPEPVDYAVCAIPAPAAPGVMRECVAAKVKVVSMFTAGFSEVGDDGEKLEKEVVEIGRQGGVIVLGPNCLGVHCPKSGLTLEGGIAPKSGHVGGVSQSGGVAQVMVLSLAAREIYISKLISLGNAADINESDYLEYLGRDEDTRIVGAYLEGIRQPDRFLTVAGQVARKKPLVVLKGGKTPAGAGAARLHTGSLAGSSVVWEAVCRQTGIVQVNDLAEMTDTIEAFTYLKPPRGRRLGIIGVGGGFGVLAADECIRAGFAVPEFPPEVKAELQKYTPLAGTGPAQPGGHHPQQLHQPGHPGGDSQGGGGLGRDRHHVHGLPHPLRHKDGYPAPDRRLPGRDRRRRGGGETPGHHPHHRQFRRRRGQGVGAPEALLRTGAPVYFTFAQAARAVARVVGYYERQPYASR